MFPYRYTIVEITEGKETGFKAIIPSFPNIYIVAESPSELHEAIKTMINEEIKYLDSKGKKIPKADNIQEFSGNFTVRIKPELHKRINELAQAGNVSTNKYVSNLLEEGILAK